MTSSLVRTLFAPPVIHRWVLLAGVLGCVYALVAAWSFTTDDAFISLRYARHWANGDGISWNVGELERVEGYSNFLFVVLGAAAIRLGLDAMLVLKLVSCAALLLSGLVMYRITKPWTSPLCATIPAILLWGYPFTQWWTVSGLETAVYVLVVIGAIAAFVHGGATHHAGTWQRLAGLLGFVAALVRPEGPLVVIAMLATLAIHRVRANATTRAVDLRAAGRIIGSFAVPFAIYIAWRFGHFGDVLPHPVHCKANHRGSPWTLILWFAPLAVIPLGLAAAAWRAWRQPAVLVCLVLAVLYGVMLYGVDPSIAYGNRHFLAVYAVLGIPAAFGVHRLARRWGEARIVIGFAALVATAWAGFDIIGLLEREALAYHDRADARLAVARHVAARVDAASTIAIGDVGVVGDALPGVAIFDAYCLNNKAMTRAPLRDSAAALAAAILADEPAVIVISSRNGETCQPRAKVFRLMLADPAFAAYELTAVFGADGDEFHYWVYERRRAILAS